MMKVEAIVRPEAVSAVREAMVAAGATGVTVATVIGHGSQGGMTHRWRGHDYTVSLLPKAVVMTVIDDADLKEVIESVTSAARTGDLGDGKIFVSPVIEAVRIRTGELGSDALS